MFHCSGWRGGGLGVSLEWIVRRGSGGSTVVD